MTTQDETLRALEREAGSSPLARYRFRVACLRAGQPERAGFDAGDLVAIEETADASLVGHRAAARALVRRTAFGELLAEWHDGEDRRCWHRDSWTLLEPARPEGAERAA